MEKNIKSIDWTYNKKKNDNNKTISLNTFI